MLVRNCVEENFKDFCQIKVEKSDKTMTGKKPTKVEIEPQVK